MDNFQYLGLMDFHQLIKLLSSAILFFLWELPSRRGIRSKLLLHFILSPLLWRSRLNECRGSHYKERLAKRNKKGRETSNLFFSELMKQHSDQASQSFHWQKRPNGQSKHILQVLENLKSISREFKIKLLFYGDWNQIFSRFW